MESPRLLRTKQTAMGKILTFIVNDIPMQAIILNPELLEIIKQQEAEAKKKLAKAEKHYMPVPYPKPEPRLKNPGKPQRGGKAKPMTSERMRLEALKREAYDRIANEREPFCAGCGSPNFEHSHRFPQSFDNYRYVAVDENIDLYCRQCHAFWENGNAWRLKNGEEAMNYLLRTDKGYFVRKLGQMDKRMSEELRKSGIMLNVAVRTVFPEWAIKMVVKYL